MANILICDDSRNMIDLLKTYLETEGHSVAAAIDPIHLVAMAKAQKPDLVIMDMQMPAGGGTQAVKNLGQQTEFANAPIIFCSGMPMEQVKKLFPEEPRFRFLAKPVDLLELSKLINELLPTIPGSYST